MRARNIKPAIFKNESLGTADPILTILFEGLWCLADREGRLEDRPLRINAEIFPYRNFTLSDINGYLTQLLSLGFIWRYKVGETAVIQVVKFTKHQSPHNTEKESDLPAKPQNHKDLDPLALNNESLTVNSPSDNALIPDSLIPDLLIADVTATTKKSKKSKPKLSDQEWLESLKTKPAYKNLNIEIEYSRAEVWADANNRQCTRRFFTNWLNRAKPMETNFNSNGNGNHQFNKPSQMQQPRNELEFQKMLGEQKPK